MYIMQALHAKQNICTQLTKADTYTQAKMSCNQLLLITMYMLKINLPVINTTYILQPVWGIWNTANVSVMPVDERHSGSLTAI